MESGQGVDYGKESELLTANGFTIETWFGSSVGRG
jgi:hypothetical protein